MRDAAVVVALLCLLPDAPAFGEPSRKADVCDSRDCIAQSNGIFEKMNPDADPCDDFHEFACGGLVKNQQIPDDKGSWGNFEILGEEVDRRTKLLLEAAKSDGKAFATDEKVRAAYAACRDEERIEERAEKPLRDLLRYVGGWPVLDGENPYEWHEIVARSAEKGAGTDYVVETRVEVDRKNISSHVITLDQPRLGLSREYLVKGFEDEDVQLYYRFMVEAAKQLGAEERAAEREMKDALEFEIQMAKFSISSVERGNKSRLYNPTTVGEFGRLYGRQPPSVGKYLDPLFRDAGVGELGDDEKIVVKVPSYLRNVSRLLEATGNRVAANYVGWRIAKSRMGFLHERLRGVEDAYNKDFLGIAEPPSAAQRCSEFAGFRNYESVMAAGASSMYVRAYFTPEDKKRGEEMTEYIRRAMREMLEDNPWMDVCTKVEAKRKLDRMGSVVGYPDEMLDRNTIDGYFAGLEVTTKDHFENGLAVSRLQRKKLLEKLRKPVDRNQWTDHVFSSVVNAVYVPNANAISIAAGFMQGNVFNSKVPQSLNFGGIGTIIGHEIIHGFDDRGRQQDYEGNLVDWWEPETDEAFKERVKCVVEHYSNFRMEQVGLNVNGAKGIGQAISDIGGIKAAYIAYGNWLSESGPDPLLVGHNYTSNQLFWISYAQVWCAKFRDSYLRQRMLTVSQPPRPARIYGALSSYAKFAEDFDCPPGSRLNPKARCTVW